jgi:hypothetical protein
LTRDDKKFGILSVSEGSLLQRTIQHPGGNVG